MSKTSEKDSSHILYEFSKQGPYKITSTYTCSTRFEENKLFKAVESYFVADGLPPQHNKKK